MKLLHLIFQRRKQSRLARKPEGFAIAPILYLLGLIGVGAGVLFSGYSQILRSNQTMSNTMGTKNDLQGTATTLAASSWMATDGQTLCPPMIGTNASANCTGAAGAMYIGTSFANATAANLPANYNSVTGTGGAAETGVFKAGSGAKVLDPWGHYYIYCRWENKIGANNALMVISGGANGKIETTCASTVAGGDDLFVVWTTAVTQNRASVWQTVTSGTTVTGVQYGATGSQLNIDTSGDVSIPGTLSVTGATTLGTNGLAVTGATHLTGSLSASSGTFSSSLGVTGTTTLNALSAGTSVLSTLSAGNTNLIGTLGVSGASSLGTVTAGSSVISGLTVNGATFLGGNASTSTGVVNIGTTVVASGSSTPLLTVAKPVSNVYPFYVDQFGATYASSFNGSLNGSQSGGSVSATSLAASGATTLGGTLAVTGATTLTGAFTSNSTATATFAGAVTATSFNGNITIGSGGSGVSFTGVIPIANGGTGASTSSAALSNLLSGNFVPAANVGCCIQTSQLSSTGVAYGTYSSVTVGTDGRVISGVVTAPTANSITDGSGDSVTVGTSGGITYTIGNSVQGNWTGTGLMIGSSKAALDKLDVYGATAIGTGYAGVTAAPTNGLIVQGQVAIGTSTANGALNVNGIVNATGFAGSGAGLTNIGTSALSGTVGSSNGGTGTNTVFTQGSVVYAGASGVYSQDNSNFFYDSTNHRLGLGTAAPQTTLAVNGTTSFMLGADYTTTGSQQDVNLGAASTVRYSGGAVATFYGIVAGKNGQIILLHNASSYILTLSNLSASETTTNNQIITGTGNDIALQSNSSVILQYDSTASKWRVIGGSGGGGQGLAGQAAYYQTTGSAVVGTSSIYIVGGNVGIGTATPLNLLHVNGTMHMTAQTGGAGVAIGTGVVGGSNGYVQFNSNGIFGGDQNFFWDNINKYLGIGTSAPMAPLQVDGTIMSFNDNGWSSINDTTYGATYYGAFRGYKARGSAASPTAVQSGDVIASFDGYGYDSTGFNTAVAAMQVNAASTWTGTSATRNGYLSFFTTGSGTSTERMRIDQNGNVGIGITSPNAALHVFGNNGTWGTSAFFGINGSTPGVAIGNSGTYGEIQGMTTANSGTASSLLINPNGGNVGIGTPSPVALLDVEGVTASPGLQVGGAYADIDIRLNNTGTGGVGWEIDSANSSSGAQAGNLAFHKVGDLYSASKMVIGSSGNVGIGNTNPSTALQVTGTVTATTFAGAGTSLTGIGVTNLGGITGTPSSSTFLRGDGTWTTLAASGAATGTGTANYTARWTGTSTLGTGILYDNGSNVGIGTTNPGQALDIYEGNMRIVRDNSWAIQTIQTDSASYSPFLIFERGRGTIASPTYAQSGDAMGAINFRDTAETSSGAGIYSAATETHSASTAGANLIFQTVANTTLTQVERMRIDQNGYVGIGTTSPVDLFTVGASPGAQLDANEIFEFGKTSGTVTYGTIRSAANTLYLGTQDGGSGTFAGSQTNTNFALRTNGNDRVTILSGGNVGIGTTAPNQVLTVNGAIQSTLNSTNANQTGAQFDWATSATRIFAYNPTGSSMSFWTNSSGNNVAQQMTINSSGYVGIGNTSPGYTLDVSGTIHSTGSILTSNNGSNQFGLEPEQGESPAHGSIVNSGNARLIQFNLTSPYTALFAGPITDTGETVNGTLNISGNNSLYFSSWGGGWYMSDSTWIRSAGSKNVYMSNGFDTGSASGVNCGGGLGNGYTFDVCGSANVTGALSIGGAFSPASISMNGSLTMNRYPLYLAGSGDTNHEIGNGLESYNSTSDGETFFFEQFLDLYSRVGGHSAIFVNGSGNVGINTTSPAQSLEVNGNAQVDSNIYCGTCGNWLGSWINQNVQSGSSPNFWNPYIGYMGTNLSNWLNQSVSTGASPNFAALTVNGMTYANGGLQFPENSWMYAPGGVGRNWYIGSSDMYWELGGNGDFHFRNSGDSDVATIDYSGSYYGNWVNGAELYSRDNVWLGYMGNWMSNFLNQSVTSGSSPNFWNPYIGYMGTNLYNWLNQSVCNGCGPTFGGVYINGPGGGGKGIFGGNGDGAGPGTDDISITSWWGIGFNTSCCNSSGQTYALSMDTRNGSMWAANYYHNSDRRLKDNIQPAQGLAIIDKLNGVTFNWKITGVKSAGVIAQDVQKVMPEAVSEDRMNKNTMLSVSYDTLIAPLIEAVKELHQQLLALLTKLQDHDDRIAKLESENSRKDAEIKALQERLDKLEAAHK